MKTQVLSAGREENMVLASNLLSAGQVIAIPTDTVYGVAADGLDPEAIERLYEVKDRPRDKAIPLLLDSMRDLEAVAAEIPKEAGALAARFWPGALTLVVRARANLPAVLLAEGGTVAVRVPDHPVPRELARRLGRPLAATSANLSGGRDPASAGDVLAQLDGRIPLVLDGGPVGRGVPSTVVDLSVRPPRVLRLGALDREDLERVLGIALDANP